MLTKFQANYQQFAIRQGEKLVRSLEGLIARNSLVGDSAFFDSQQYEWVEKLESNWQVIRQELDDLLKSLNTIPNFQDISKDQYSITQDNRWKTYFFYAYGLKAEQNCNRCPQTAKLIEQIPEMKTAFFSILLPDKQIPEHRGPYKGVLRYHLALKVPEAAHKCGIKVGGETRHWQEGKSLIFDDTFPHQAWNNSEEIRVVLFLDFVRPMKFPISLFNQLMIQLIAWSPYVQSAKQNFNQWDEIHSQKN
jgi:beta-hydroxylase